MLKPPPFDAYANRYSQTIGLGRSDPRAVERFFNSAAEFVCYEILGRMLSSYEAVRYDRANAAILQARQTTQTQLGQGQLFPLSNRLLEWETCYIDDVGRFLVNARHAPQVRLSFLEHLLFECASVFQPHWHQFEERMASLLKTAGAKLSYRGLRFAPLEDERLAHEVHEPFWSLVEAPVWANVRRDMETAVRQRDTGGPNAALMAARAFESAIKIICDRRGATTGKERGAAAYVDSLVGATIIDAWEASLFRRFFAEVRNPEAHGAGSQPQPILSEAQTIWAVEFCMISIKSLIPRL